MMTAFNPQKTFVICCKIFEVFLLMRSDPWISRQKKKFLSERSFQHHHINNQGIMIAVISGEVLLSVYFLPTPMASAMTKFWILPGIFLAYSKCNLRVMCALCYLRICLEMQSTRSGRITKEHEKYRTSPWQSRFLTIFLQLYYIRQKFCSLHESSILCHF